MMNGMSDPQRTVVAPMEDCWRHIGVGGDRSCPELQCFIHCRNCPVLAQAARTFFDRPAPAGYLDAWRDVLQQPVTAGDIDTTSVLVFRLGGEWLALPGAALVEVTTTRPVHRVPHRSDKTLVGLVNIRGQLQVCVSLCDLLGLEPPPSAVTAVPVGGPLARLLVIERQSGGGVERWVFGVDEVAGVHRLARTALRAVPSTVGAAARRSTRALFDWQERTVGLLDEGWLMDGLQDRLKT